MTDDGTLFRPDPRDEDTPAVEPRAAPAPASHAWPETSVSWPDPSGTDAGAEADAEPGGSPRRFGDYLIEREIARGGMGVVYKARHLTLGRDVALKMILATRLHPTQARRFRMEAEAAARLNHPNIVPVFEVGELGGQHYFSMALVEGWSLDDRLRAGPVPPADAARWVEAAARGVHFAHSRNIVHRDIKPANVLVDADGTPKITDFGIAKRLDGGSEMTHDGQVIGTPGFMAPEQAAGRVNEVGPPADVYALGATLYALLTRRPPFRGEAVEDTLRQVLREDPEPPSRSNEAVDRDLEAVCLKCMEKEPSRRYASAAELADDLGRWRRGEPTLARPATPAEALRKWVRREPWRAGAYAAVTALGLLSVAAVCFYSYKETEKARQLAEKAVELSRSKGELERANEGLERAIADVKVKEGEVRVIAAEAILRQAQTFAEGGETQVALLRIAEAARTAPDGHAGLRELARTQMAATAAGLPRPVRLFLRPDGHGPFAWARYAPGGRVLVGCGPINKGRAGPLAFDAAGRALALTFPPIRPSGRGGPPWRGEYPAVDAYPSADGTWMLTRSAVAAQRIDPEAGRALALPVDGACTLSPDARRVFVRTPGEPDASPASWGVLYDAESGGPVGGELILSRRAPAAPPVFSDDGKTLLGLDVGPTPGSFVARRWDAGTGRALPPLALPAGHDLSVDVHGGWMWMAAGGRTAVLSVPGPGVWRNLLVLDGQTGRRVGGPFGPFPLLKAALSPDGRALATASTTTSLPWRPLGADARTGLRLWSLPDGRPLGPGWDVYASVDSLAFSPDGRRLLVAATSAAVEYELPPPPPEIPVSGRVLMVGTPEGGGVIAATRTEVRRWGPDGKARWTIPVRGVPADDQGHPAALSPDGRLLAVADGRRVRFWDAATGKEARPAVAHPDGEADPKARVFEVAFSADGRALMSRLAEETHALIGKGEKTAVRLWDVATGVTVAGPVLLGMGMGAFSPGADGRSLLWREAIADAGAFPNLPPAASWLVRGDTRGRDDSVISMTAAVPGGRYVFTREYMTFSGRLRDARTLQPVGRPLPGPVMRVAFRGDGRVMATASGRQVRLWWLDTRHPVCPPISLPGQAGEMSFTLDGKALLVACADRGVLTWGMPDVAPERLEALTGMRLDEKAGVAPLAASEWAGLLNEPSP